jgi:hypothetical protein
MRRIHAHRIMLWSLLCGALSVYGVPNALAAPARLTLTRALVLPQALPLIAAEQEQAAVAAALTSPEALATRERSRTEYQHQSAPEVAQTLSAAFPTLISRQEGGPPPLPAGQNVAGFKAPNVAVVALGSREAGLIDSSVPMATQSSPGQWQPVNLSLRNTGSAFEASNPFIATRLPKNLAEGAQLPSVGVSLTPTDEHGQLLGSESGQIDGSTVLFPNTQQDSDTVMKLLPLGADVSTTLRSVFSPEHLFYKVGMPHGSRLVTEPDHAVNVLTKAQPLR